MIFDISLSKTGTGSLAAALQLLGFTTCHGCPKDMQEDFIARIIADDFKGMQVTQHFDAVINLLNFAHFQLDRDFPDAKFIYLERDEDAWLKSTLYQLNVNDQQAVTRKLVSPFMYGRLMNLGCLRTEEPAYLVETMRRHRRRVFDYFKGRESGKLLVMQITDGWEPLCSFLDRPVPDALFPRLHVSPTRP